MDQWSEYYRLVDQYEKSVSDSQKFNIRFSEQSINQLLLDAEIIPFNPVLVQKTLSQIVYLEGDSYEVYSYKERELIDEIKEVYVYEPYYKESSRSTIPVNVYAVNLKNSKDELYDSILCIKILGKAIDGFNVVLFVGEDTLHFGCRKYSSKESDDFMVSIPISDYETLEELVESFAEIRPTDNFGQYYREFSYAISYRKEKTNLSLEDKVIKSRGEQFSYINNLMEVSKILRIDMHHEIERYHSFFEDKEVWCDDDFDKNIEIYSDELSDIKSNRVNPMELLFEAEEYLRFASDKEEQLQINHNISSDLGTESQDVEDDYLDDPEELIKRLKQLRGI